jgi:hypothetical protein
MGSPQYINTARQYTITRTFLYFMAVKSTSRSKEQLQYRNFNFMSVCQFSVLLTFVTNEFFCFFAGIETSNDGCIKERRNPDTWIYRKKVRLTKITKKNKNIFNI